MVAELLPKQGLWFQDQSLKLLIPMGRQHELKAEALLI